MSIILKTYPVLFFLFLPVITLLYSCNDTNVNQDSTTDSEPCSCIEAIIVADEEAGKTRNHACEKQSLSQTINDYAFAINAMDYTGCPTEFKLAMLNHADAWTRLLPVTDLFDERRGEMHDLFDEIKLGKEATEFSPLVDEIWESWSAVTKARETCE